MTARFVAQPQAMVLQARPDSAREGMSPAAQRAFPILLGEHLRSRTCGVRFAFAACALGAAGMGLPNPAQACSDLANICEQQQQQFEYNNEMARQAAAASAQADADAQASAAAAARAEASRPKRLMFYSGAVAFYSTSAGEPGAVVAAGKADEQNAQAAAMSICYSTGAINCRVTATWKRGFAAIAIAADGGLFLGIGDDANAARKAAKALCSAQAANCKIKATYDNQGTLFYAD